MKYCPACKFEYEDHAVKCSDCGGDLVDLQEAKAVEAQQEESSGDQDIMNWQQLTTVGSKNEAKQIREIMKQFGIPMQYEEGKDGFDIQVPRVQYQTALGIIHQVFAATARQSGVAEEMALNESDFEAQALAAGEGVEEEQASDGFGAKIILVLAVVAAAALLLKFIM